MSLRLRTVLAALDGSPRAAGVFQAALSLAEQFDARLHVFRALVVPPDFPPAAANRRGDQLPRQMEQQAIAELTSILGLMPPARVLPPVLRTASQPWRAILQVADELDVDLVVLGSHGYGGLDRLLGTTAGKVANGASRNVLIVHRYP